MTEVVDVEAQEESTALVRRDSYVPRICCTPGEVKQLIEEVEVLVRDHMRPNKDYMKIPGTPKPSLLKPGAERLNRFMGFGSTVECVRFTEDWEGNFVHYVYRVGIGPVTPDGVQPRAYAEASANSREKKWARATTYDIANTVQQMAEKRAYVAATRTATNTSDFFTSDLEDLPPELLSDDKPKSKPIPTPMSGPDEPGDTVMPWGNKHKGQTLSQILAEDPGYIKWLKRSLDEKEAKGDLPEDQVYLKSAVNLIAENM